MRRGLRGTGKLQTLKRVGRGRTQSDGLGLHPRDWEPPVTTMWPGGSGTHRGGPDPNQILGIEGCHARAALFTVA